MLSIEEYADFRDYLATIRRPDRSYDRFVSMVLHLPRRLALQHLRMAASDDDLDVMCEAVDLLSRISAEQGSEVCLRLLKHDDPDVRQVAVESLGVTEVDCESQLLGHLSHEPDGNVRHACVKVLGELGTAKSITVLSALAMSDSSEDYEGRPITLSIQQSLARIRSRGIS